MRKGFQTRFKPGEASPVSGVYRIYHDAHRAPHDCMLAEGQTFPSCRKCGKKVRFELSLAFAADADGQSPSLLIVEEEVAAAKVRESLRHEGYNVATAPDSQAALGLLRRHEFDAVITNVDLEEPSDGLKLARTLKRIKSRPVVILSVSKPREIDLRAAMQLRVNYLLVEPFDMGELKDALSRMIAHRADLLEEVQEQVE